MLVKLEAWKEQLKSKAFPVHRSVWASLTHFHSLPSLICQYLNSNPAELMTDQPHMVVSSAFKI